MIDLLPSDVFDEADADILRANNAPLLAELVSNPTYRPA